MMNVPRHRLAIDPAQHLATTTLSGAIEAREIRDAFEDMLAHPDFAPGMNSLWDLREAQLETISVEAVQRLVAFVAKHSEARGEGRAALVAESDVAFGICRIYEAFASALPTDVRAFRRLEEATEWLTEGLDTIQRSS